MKRTTSVFLLAIVLSTVLVSCRAKKVDCPAYGQHSTPANTEVKS